MFDETITRSNKPENVITGKKLSNTTDVKTIDRDNEEKKRGRVGSSKSMVF